MERFKIEGFKTIRSEFGAKDLKTALEMFFQYNPGYEITHINEEKVLGRCDVCNEYILEDSSYYSCEQGTYWCNSHGVEGDQIF